MTKYIGVEKSMRILLGGINILISHTEEPRKKAFCTLGLYLTDMGVHQVESPVEINWSQEFSGSQQADVCYKSENVY